jgi:hypothetical protein
MRMTSRGDTALFASAAVGAMVGFIFGVPKSIAVKTGDECSPRVYRPNSNLETISDWLTGLQEPPVARK